MPFILTDDNIRIHYTDKGIGKAIVFVHGWASNGAGFLTSVRYLKNKYRVITIDLRGNGNSEVVDNGITMERCAKDLEQLLDNLNLKEVTLIGWSMGAQVVFEYINNYGCKRLKNIGIVDMTPKLINDEEWNLGLYHGTFKAKDSLKALSDMSRDWISFTEDFYKAVAPHFTEKDLVAIRHDNKLVNPNAAIAMWIAMSNKDYREMLSRINVPAFIMYGEKSTLYSKETAEYIHSKIPNSKLICFEGCSHLLVLDNPEMFNRMVEELVENGV